MACTDHFNEIYDATFAGVRKFVAAKCTDTAYLSDILQEIYLEYYKLLLYKGRAYVKNDRAMLFKIAKRKIYAYYSLKEKLKRFLPLGNRNVDGEEYEDEDILREDDTFDGFFEEMEAKRIWGCIETYPADIRKICYLYFYEEMSLAEIAEATGYGLSAVKNKLYRTLREIREQEGLT